MSLDVDVGGSCMILNTLRRGVCVDHGLGEHLLHEHDESLLRVMGGDGVGGG